MINSDHHHRDAKPGERRAGLRLPRDGRVDSTAALLAKPYDYVRETCARFASELFEARLLLRRTICMRGPEASALFYDESRFKRRGATPEPVRATLLGKGGVQGLDHQAHRNRKAMFMSLMGPDRIAKLSEIVEREWLLDAKAWSVKPEVGLYDALHPMLMRSVCSWAGVPLPTPDIERRTRDVVPLFDRAAALGVGHLRARIGRFRSERWLASVIKDVRAGRLAPPAETALAVVAAHRDASGRLLTPRIAAVELLNVLRPTVAVSVYIVFVAHALHSFPAASPRGKGDEFVDQFVQEVRRFYPFFPAVMAKARRDFSWKGIRFPKGRRVLLDLHATNLSSAWQDPDVFRPDRFDGDAGEPFKLIPQGGGDHYRHHRCPGEWITLALMKVAVRILTERIAYELPDQDIRIDRRRLPALPVSRLIIKNVGMS